MIPELTKRQIKSLELLHKSPLYPHEFYLAMWPEGRWVKRDPGSAKGGPGRGEYVANMYLGKLHPFVSRTGYLVRRPNAGKWQLTEEGISFLREHEQVDN